MNPLTVTERKFNLIVSGLIWTICLLRVFTTSAIEIHPDEAYYWMWSRFPALSYYDQGPGVAYYILLFTNLFSSDQWVLRLSGLVACAISLNFVFFAAREAGLSRIRAVIATLITMLLPGFFNASFMIVHDSLLLVFWNAALFFSLRYIRTAQSSLMIFTFLMLGLGALSKHTMIFFAMAMVLWLLIQRRFHLLKSPVSYAGVLLAGITVMPIILWNMQNNWDGVSAILHLRSSGGEHGSGSTGAYLAGQMITFSPVLYILLWMSAAVAIYHRWKNRKIKIEKGTKSDVFISQRTFLWLTALILPVFFLFLSSSREIQANWLFPAYPSAVILLVAGPEMQPLARKKWYRNLLTAGIGIALLLNLIVSFSGPLAGLSKKRIEPYWIPAYRTAGYSDIARRVEEAMQQYSVKQVAANRYQDAAILSFYLKGQPYVPSANIMQQNQYSYWKGLEKGKSYVFVQIQENTCEKSPGFLGPVLSGLFEETVTLPEKEIIKDGYVVKRYQIFIARNYEKGWDAGLARYMREGAIYDIMPNLRGYSSGENQQQALSEITAAYEALFLSRKGRVSCDFFTDELK